uniref:Uncharacterized protein n=1 Tax=Micrurus lemniscatus lemniscatus TaxID=129467 RepID=A0A2D4HEG8_MICLE
MLTVQKPTSVHIHTPSDSLFSIKKCCTRSDQRFLSSAAANLLTTDFLEHSVKAEDDYLGRWIFTYSTLHYSGYAQWLLAFCICLCCQVLTSSSYVQSKFHSMDLN